MAAGTAFGGYVVLIAWMVWRSAHRYYWTGWALFALFSASSEVSAGSSTSPASLFGQVLPSNLLQGMVGGLCGRGIMLVADRYGVEGTPARPATGWRPLAAQMAAVIAATLLSLVGRWALLALVTPMDMEGVALGPAVPLLSIIRRSAHSHLIIMLSVVVGHHAWQLRERARAGELGAAHLASRLADAENRALRMQIQPHFLFNTLHSIATLIHHDPRAADAMITRLADLLRLTLDLGSDQEIPLRDELHFVEGYLAIELVRFRDRLDVRYRVADECRRGLVPAFLLQPLVENALKHGFSDEPRLCTIDIVARREGDDLCIMVTDDGEGYRPGCSWGTGLNVTRERLQLLYGARHEFRVDGSAGRGTEVSIRLPWHDDIPFPVCEQPLLSATHQSPASGVRHPDAAVRGRRA